MICDPRHLAVLAPAGGELLRRWQLCPRPGGRTPSCSPRIRAAKTHIGWRCVVLLGLVPPPLGAQAIPDLSRSSYRWNSTLAPERSTEQALRSRPHRTVAGVTSGPGRRFRPSIRRADVSHRLPGSCRLRGLFRRPRRLEPDKLLALDVVLVAGFQGSVEALGGVVRTRPDKKRTPPPRRLARSRR